MVFASDLDLDEVEARVVGSLIEKSMTTPDSYPLSTNGVMTACNQKSARDPVMSVTSVMVDAAALALRQRGWTRTVRGGRTSKHRHILDEHLSVGPAQLAVLGVLLLRGPQTTGELRQRTDRMHGFESVDEVENTLLGMASREVPLVRRLERQPGQKEARWTHLLSSAHAGPSAGAASEPGENGPAAADAASSERSDPTADAAGGVAAAPPTREPPLPKTESASTAPAADSAEEVRALRAEVAELRRRFDALCASLGEDNI